MKRSSLILTLLLTTTASGQELTYDSASVLAVQQRKPLITYVGSARHRQISGAVTCATPTLPGYTPSIVVALPGGEWLNERAVLSANASDAEIAAAMRPRQVSRSVAGPFTPPLSVERDDDLSRGPWPVTMEFPVGFERYRRARMSQEIAVTNDRDRITPVPRESVNGGKWARSGGMMIYPRVRSDVYRFFPTPPSTYIANLPVLNSFGHYQHNRGWWREFAVGTAFMDVLSLDGAVFEIRKRSKAQTGWESDVIFEEPSARPAGYSGKIGQSCTSCHEGGHGNAPGSGPYAGGLVPGSDGVYSFPFPALER